MADIQLSKLDEASIEMADAIDEMRKVLDRVYDKGVPWTDLHGAADRLRQAVVTHRYLSVIAGSHKHG